MIVLLLFVLPVVALLGLLGLDKLETAVLGPLDLGGGDPLEPLAATRAGPAA